MMEETEWARGQLRLRDGKVYLGRCNVLGKIIVNADYNTFFQSSESHDIDDRETEIHGTDPMPKNCLHFVYGYTV